MKRSIIIFSLMLVSLVVFGQADTVVTVPGDGGVIKGVPGWLEAAIGLVIVLIPTALWAKGRYRLGKFVALGKVIADAVADRHVDANEIQLINKAFKELIAKEES